MPSFFSQNLNDAIVDQLDGGGNFEYRPQIAWLTPTTYVVVWEQRASGEIYSDIFARVFALGGIPLTDAFRVNVNTTYDQSYVNVVATSGGGFMVSWLGPDTSGSVPTLAVWTRGFIPETFAPLDFVDTRITSLADMVRRPVDLGRSDGFGGGDLAFSGGGSMLVTWTQDIILKNSTMQTTHTEVFGAYLDASGNRIGSPFMISPAEPIESQDSQWALATAAMPVGFAVLYQSQENHRTEPGAEFGTFDINYYLKLVPTGEVFKISFSASDVAYTGDGRFVVVGTDNSGDGDIMAQVFGINGQILSEPTRINENTTGSQINPSIAGFEAGNPGFIVTWNDQGVIRAAALRNDLTHVQSQTAPSFPVSGPLAEYFGSLVGVSVGPDGTFAIVWAGENDNGRHLFQDTYIQFAFNYTNVITGTEGADALQGTDLGDDMKGLGGADILRPGKGDDRADGGAGIDRVAYYHTDPALGGVQVSLVKQGLPQDLGWAGKDILIGIESLSGTPFADRLEGDDGANWLWGSPSRDGGTFFANNNDILIGNGGNDLLVVGTGNHTLSGGSGNDTVAFTDGGDETVGVVVSLLKQGSAQVTGAGSWTLTGIENLSGGVKNDTLTGDGNVNILAGDEGSDTLIGMAGNDRLYGDGYFWVNSNGVISLFVSAEGGNDILIGGPGEDALFGGPGIDTASYAGDEGGVFVNLTLGRGYGNASFGDTYDSIENVIGTDYNDFIIGDPGTNRLDGAGGDDTIIGAVGPDEIIGGTGLDWASYEDNSGVVFINLTLARGYNNAAEGDTYEGIENLIGGLMDDFFIGDEQANRLNGAMGADTLLGAGGADIFMFTYAPGATSTWGNPNVDLILDFTTGVDTIELSAGAFPGLAAGALPAAAFYAGAAAHDGDDRIVYDAASGKLWFDPDGNGAQAAMLFATLGETSHPVAIAASDFVVV